MSNSPSRHAGKENRSENEVCRAAPVPAGSHGDACRHRLRLVAAKIRRGGSHGSGGIATWNPNFRLIVRPAMVRKALGHSKVRRSFIRFMSPTITGTRRFSVPPRAPASKPTIGSSAICRRSTSHSGRRRADHRLYPLAAASSRHLLSYSHPRSHSSRFDIVLDRFVR